MLQSKSFENKVDRLFSQGLGMNLNFYLNGLQENLRLTPQDTKLDMTSAYKNLITKVFQTHSISSFRLL